MITNNYLTEIAKAMASESYVVPTYMAFGSTVLTPNAASTSLTGEQDARTALTDSRSSNVVTFSGIRTGALVSGSSDTLNSIAMFSASTGGTMLSENSLASIIHTTAFDVAVDFQITVSRA